MSVQMTVDIPDLARFDDLMKRAPLKATEELNKGLRRGSLLIQRNARIEAPVRTGNLRARIESFVFDGYAVISPRAKYSIYVHEGTGQYARGKTTGRIKRGGIKPNPFMERALEQSKPEVQATFKEAADNVARYIRE